MQINDLGEEKEVGIIQLEDWPSTQYTDSRIHIGSTPSLIQQSNSSLNRPSSNLYVAPEDTTSTTQDPRLKVRIELIESMVPPFDVFLLVIAVLVNAAELGVERVLRDYQAPLDVGSVWIAFAEPTPVRTSPPFFEVKGLMRAMATIPKYMIKKGVFQEAFVTVEVDGVSVADGCMILKDVGVGLKDMKTNISVS